MYVVYHSSNSFVSVAGTSIISLFENNRDVDDIHILYIEKGVTEENKNLLNGIAETYGRSMEFMAMPDWSEDQKLGTKLKSCKSSWFGFGYNRLFLTEYIPKEVDRVLYLDSDTIVTGSLKELWETDIDDFYMAGVDDCLSSKYRVLVGIDSEGTYCNAGMLLINLAKWRKDKVIDAFIDLIKQNNGYFVFNEQTILNSFFSGKIKILPQKYNVNTLVCTFDFNDLMLLRKPYRFSYTKEEYYNARNNPVIIHFTGNFYIRRRPWVENSDHPYRDVYLKYRKISPWMDCPLNKDDRKKMHMFFTAMAHILPNSIMLRAVSLLYNDIRPYFFRYKKYSASS